MRNKCMDVKDLERSLALSLLAAQCCHNKYHWQLTQQTFTSWNKVVEAGSPRSGCRAAGLGQQPLAGRLLPASSHGLPHVCLSSALCKDTSQNGVRPTLVIPFCFLTF